jgi:hypothetical protein
MEFREHSHVVGGNYIGRMDANTVRALVRVGLRYCVVSASHYYRPFAYIRPSTQPLPLCTADGSIWLVPIPVETYGLPWFAIRLLVDSALIRSREEGAERVLVLMHPFRDGSKRHLGQLEELLRYLVQVRHLRPVTLEETTSTSPPTQTLAQVVISLERINACYPESSRQFWTRSELYFNRISALSRSLAALGRQPCLALDTERGGDTFAVYPELPAGGVKLIRFDPLAGLDLNSRGWQRLVSLLDGTRGLNVFCPPGHADHLALRVDMCLPRHVQDLTGFLPEVIIRLAYRLNKGRLLF